MKFMALGGGAEEFGRSNYRIETAGTKLMVDYGILIDNIIRLPYDVVDEEIKALLLSHPHLDHIGGGPVFAKKHPEALIYAPKPVKPLARLLYRDLIKIAEQKGEKPLFSKEEMHVFLDRLNQIYKPGWFQIPGTEIYVNPWINKHLRGSCSWFIDSPDEEIIFSGDILFDDTPTESGEYKLPYFPKRKKRIAVVEATYGNDEHPPREHEVRRLIQLAKETTDNGGNVLICAFAVGGCQNIALELDRAGIPCYVDGMGRKAFEIYGLLHWCEFDKLDKRSLIRSLISPVDKFHSRAHREEIAAQSGVVVVTSSGWDEGGPARFYTERWAGNPKNMIIFPQYVPEYPRHYTLAGELLATRRGEKVSYYDEYYGRVVEFNLNAQVEKLHLHHHARGSEIAKWVADLQADHVILTHGSEEGCRGLKKNILTLPAPDYSTPCVYFGRNLEEIII